MLLPAPSLDFNPVLWREWRRRNLSSWLRVVWLLYGLVAAFFTLYTLLQGPALRRDLSPWVNGLQVAFGLLLLTVDSVTALAEERAGGTLDLLLTTPLPTRSIIFGKWWGSYRAILWFAVLPLLLAGAVAEGEGGWVLVLLLAAVLLVYGAYVTSLGLALATWVRKTMAALALAVVLYLLVTAGWVLLIMVLLDHSRASQGLAMASPFFAAGSATELAHFSSARDMSEFTGWLAFWLIVHLIATFALLGMTLATFDHYMGRMRDTASGRKRRVVRS